MELFAYCQYYITLLKYTFLGLGKKLQEGKKGRSSTSEQWNSAIAARQGCVVRIVAGCAAWVFPHSPRFSGKCLSPSRFACNFNVLPPWCTLSFYDLLSWSDT